MRMQKWRVVLLFNKQCTRSAREAYIRQPTCTTNHQTYLQHVSPYLHNLFTSLDYEPMDDPECVERVARWNERFLSDTLGSHTDTESESEEEGDELEEVVSASQQER